MEAPDKADKVRPIVNTESPVLPLLFLSSEVFYDEAGGRKYLAVGH